MRVCSTYLAAFAIFHCGSPTELALSDVTDSLLRLGGAQKFTVRYRDAISLNKISLGLIYRGVIFPNGTFPIENDVGTGGLVLRKTTDD